MTKLLFLSILPFLLFSCTTADQKSDAKKSEKYLAFVDNQTIYGLLNSDAINENHIYESLDNVLDRQIYFCANCDSTMLAESDSLFSDADKEFIKMQYQNSIHFVLDPKLLKDKKLIETVKTKFNSIKELKEYGEKLIEKYHRICTIQLPLFNLKKDLAIVQFSYYCGGLCGEGGTYIFKLNKKGKWEYYQTIEEWIS